MLLSPPDETSPIDREETAPFFIVGVGRSGTTLLRLMLNAHPDVAIPYETHFIDAYAERAEEFGDLAERSARERLVKSLLDEDMVGRWNTVPKVEDVLTGMREPSVAAAIESLFDTYAASFGKSRWGDKSDYLDRMHVIAGLFPRARFVHIVRDGRDVANSVLRLPWGPRDLIAAAQWWHEHVRIGRIVGSVLGPDRYSEVRYEDLVENPTRELRQLCEFLRLDWSPAMLDYHSASHAFVPSERRTQHHNVDKPPQKARVFAWRREMSPSRVRIFEDHAAESLRAFGYETGSRSAPPVRQAFVKSGILAGRVVRHALHRARRRAR